MEKEYDFVIIGSGLGGLLCAKILMMEGYSVCVLEKNRQYGGVLQVFAREGSVFDTGVHYVGCLDKGQNLYKIFDYVGLFPELKMVKMDEDGFDVILFSDDETEYKYAQGIENFRAQMIGYFPEEKAGIDKYCDRILDIVNNYKLYHLEYSENPFDLPESLWVNTYDFIKSCTDNIRLQSVLGGINILYAGERKKTPLYIHALILYSYLQSAYKIVGGGGAIQRILTRQLKQGGVTLKHYAEVVKIANENDVATHVVLKNGEIVKGKNFISNIHPAVTMNMLQDFNIKKVYKKRIESLENTSGCIAVNITLKEATQPYQKRNLYYFDCEDSWEASEYTAENWPNFVGIYCNESRKNPGYVESVILLGYMFYDEVKKWEDTFNTFPNYQNDRSEEYQAFKKQKGDELIKLAQRKLTWLKDEDIANLDISTPLTYRDYIATPEGGTYGVIKDHNNPLVSFLAPKTKVPNVYLTGQNLNVHGVVGVAISSLITCGEFIPLKELLQKVNEKSLL